MTSDDLNNSKNSYKYICNYCSFFTNNKNDFRRHSVTIKHKKLKNNDFSYEKTQKNSLQCDCGKIYKYKQGLYAHKKKCNYKEVTSVDNKNLIIMLINENKEMRKMMQDQQEKLLEIIPNIGNNNTHNTINNKQKFNINVFLNEKCKDAISMNEFIEKIEVSMKNLLTTKDKGLSEGLSNIIIENMNKLSLYERPIHCTDKKRETLYIKNDEWEKDEKSEQINELVKMVEKKQMKNINQWTDKNPNYMNNELLQEEYINLVRSCTNSVDSCKDKVIRKLCDNVYLTEKQWNII